MWPFSIETINLHSSHAELDRCCCCCWGSHFSLFTLSSINVHACYSNTKAEIKPIHTKNVFLFVRPVYYPALCMIEPRGPTMELIFSLDCHASPSKTRIEELLGLPGIGFDLQSWLSEAALNVLISLVYLFIYFNQYLKYYDMTQQGNTE